MILGPQRGTLDSDGLLAAYPWPKGRWVRAMMVTTLDGAAAGPDGLSGSISSPADREVFDSVRRHAHAVLVGSGTVRAEGYAAMHGPTPVVVSGSLDLPWETGLLTSSEHTPVIVTSEAADPDRLAATRERVDVVVTPGEAVDLSFALDALAERGLSHVVCEGGPRLLADLARAGLVDEADITVSRTFAGTERTPRTPMLDDVQRFDLAHVLSADGFLMLRYVRLAA